MIPLKIERFTTQKGDLQREKVLAFGLDQFEIYKDPQPYFEETIRGGRVEVEAGFGVQFFEKGGSIAVLVQHNEEIVAQEIFDVQEVHEGCLDSASAGPGIICGKPIKMVSQFEQLREGTIKILVAKKIDGVAQIKSPYVRVTSSWIELSE